MAKIKVGELRNLRKNTGDKVKTCEFEGLNIEVRMYLPIDKKIKLVHEVYLSLMDTNGLATHLFDVMLNIFIVEYYTNMTLPKDTSEAYDLITETGIFDFVCECLYEKEMNELKNMMLKYIDVKKEEERQNNTFSAIVSQLVEAFDDKLPSQENMDALIRSLIK